MSEPCERESARMCCIRTDCVILDLSSPGAGCTYRGCPGIFSFIATRTIFRVLGLIHITIVFIHHDCIFPSSTSNEMQEVLSICGSRDSLPLCLIEIWLDQSKHCPANTGAAARAYHFIRDNAHCMRNINYPNYPRIQTPNYDYEIG